MTGLKANQKRKLMSWRQKSIRPQEVNKIAGFTVLGFRSAKNSENTFDPEKFSHIHALRRCGAFPNVSRLTIFEDRVGPSSFHWPVASNALRSMSYESQGFRFHAKTPDMFGHYCVKMEVHKTSTVKRLPAIERWKHASFRTFVPVLEKTKITQQTVIL